LSNLVRLRSGPFTLCQAWTLGELATLIDETGDDLPFVWPELAVHPDAALLTVPAHVVDPQVAQLLSTGRSWELDRGSPDSAGVADGARARLYDLSGSMLGVVGWNAASAEWRPVKMVG
jgi:tRNA U55 pseudouridine synthase TruB